MRVLCAAVLAAVLAAPAGAAKVDDAEAHCVRPSTLRGPTAMLEAPTAPFRTAAGVFTDMQPSPGAWGVPLAGLAFAGGLVDTVVWLGTGLADTLSGGYFEIAPPEATVLGLRPLRPPFASGAPPLPQQRARCGGPRGS
jgi:hypothetical protein